MSYSIRKEVMGADLDKIKRGSDDEEHHSDVEQDSASEKDNEADDEDADIKDPLPESRIWRKRSGSIYERPKWQDQVSQGSEDCDAVLFSNRLSRAYTVAACRFRRRGVNGSPLRVIREENRNGSDVSMVIF